MRAVVFIALMFGFQSIAYGWREPDRWIQYGKANEPTTQDEYHRVAWDKLALVIFEDTQGRGGVHLWTTADNRVFQLGTTSLKSESAEVIRKLIRSESNRWIKGFVYGGPGKPGQPERLEAYCDLSKAKVVARAHPIEAQDNVFIKVSFDEGGNAPTLGISDEQAYNRIRGIMEASVNPGKRHRNTASTAVYPNADLPKPHSEPHSTGLAETRPVLSSAKKTLSTPARSVKSPSRRPSYSRSASRGSSARRRTAFVRKAPSKQVIAKRTPTRKAAPSVGRYLP